MCGIAGAFSQERFASVMARMEKALHIMRERGPDRQSCRAHSLTLGDLYLGQTRLSVIDLNERASQPMYSVDGRFAIIFNGEIYNYIELRRELIQAGREFVTQSDTEVLLACWEIWGKEALARLNGMFAFAVFDFFENKISLVRDAFGIKPLFYSFSSDGFFFASDIRAMRALSAAKPSLNWQRSYDYLVFGEYDHGEETFFSEFRSVPAGNLIEIQLESSVTTGPVPWWRPSISPTSELSFSDASEQLRELLLNSIKLHLRSDVPVGAALSGGIDSSIIVCAMRYIDPNLPINTFSFVADDPLVSEGAWVDLVNEYVGAHGHKVLISSSDLASDLEDLIDTQGEPFGSTSIYAQYRVYKVARQMGITVTLDGQGADEMMGGYNGYPGQRILSMLDRGEYRNSVDFLLNWSSWPGRSKMQAIKRLVGAASSGSLYNFLRGLDGSQSSPAWLHMGPLMDERIRVGFPPVYGYSSVKGRRMMASLAQSLTERGLPSLLRHGDRNSMRFSVESRVPFLSREVVDFMLCQPEHYLVSQSGETKALLRSAMRGIVPDAILDRRDKIGFATPESGWIIGMADAIRDWLAADLEIPFLNQECIVKHFDSVVDGDTPYTWLVWRWINFSRWYRGLN